MSQPLLDGLVQGIASMQLILPEHAPEKLIDYIALLLHWNKAFNLTAIRDPEEMVSKHLLDSLSVLPYIGDGNVIDVGSGAGLPGIPLALAKPEQHFVLIDTNGKKTRFLNQAKMVLGLNNVVVIHQRIEEYQTDKAVDVVIARAYASTAKIIHTTQHLYNKTTRLLVMQGKLDQYVDVDGYVVNSAHKLKVPALEAERHLLEIIKQ